MFKRRKSTTNCIFRYFFVAQIGTWDSHHGLEISRPILPIESDVTQAPNRTLDVTTIKVGVEISRRYSPCVVTVQSFVSRPGSSHPGYDRHVGLVNCHRL